MNIVRMNFSHGTHDYHASVIANLRASFEREPGRSVAVALDTKGPEIRTGELVGGSLLIPRDHVFVLSTNEEHRDKGDLDHVFVDYAQIGRLGRGCQTKSVLRSDA